jgi:regulator of cell morphogenesis and NO signaling
LRWNKDRSAAQNYIGGMTIFPNSLVADIATAHPASIKVFQRHRIDFCCGGKIALADVCEQRQLGVTDMVTELQAALETQTNDTDWTRAPLTDLVSHIQRTFHRPLEAELPRLRAMVDKVVSRHGDRRAATLLPLQTTFAPLQAGLLEHMANEDAVLFPAIVALESGGPVAPATLRSIDQPIAVLEAEHAAAGTALARLSDLTDGYVPPEDACPTFRGLYYGLAELERDMHLHVHLENHVLFPRTAAMFRNALTVGHG